MKIQKKLITIVCYKTNKWIYKTIRYIYKEKKDLRVPNEIKKRKVKTISFSEFGSTKRIIKKVIQLVKDKEIE